jgi:hypothetical protein
MRKEGSGEDYITRSFSSVLLTKYHSIRVIKSRRLRWERHVACKGARKGAYRALVGKPEERRPLERPRHRWGIILKWAFEKWVGAWTGSIWRRTGTGGGLL